MCEDVQENECVEGTIYNRFIPVKCHSIFVGLVRDTAIFKILLDLPDSPEEHSENANVDYPFNKRRPLEALVTASASQEAVAHRIVKDIETEEAQLKIRQFDLESHVYQ